MLRRLVVRSLRWCCPTFFKQARCWYYLAFQFGQYRSLRSASAVDASGRALPWYTYPAIEFLNQLDFSGKCAFEWGAGNSTFYWARRCEHIAAIESSERWYAQVCANKPQNADILLLKDEKEYVTAPRRWDQKFDVIAVDGDFRLDCAIEAPRHLADGGLIIIDNADTQTDITQHLRDRGFVEIDFSGFGPNNDVTWVTSIFFKSAYGFQPRSRAQPMSGIGGINSTHRDDRPD